MKQKGQTALKSLVRIFFPSRAEPQLEGDGAAGGLPTPPGLERLAAGCRSLLIPASRLLVGAPPRPALAPGSRSTPAVCMRAETGPRAESTGFLDMRVQDCGAELLSSTLAHIGPFLEDEFGAESPPMRLTVRNVSVTIKVQSATL